MHFLQMEVTCLSMTSSVKLLLMLPSHLEEEDIKGEMEFEEDELTAQQVESWSLIELEEYLLTFSITEEETTWLQVSTKNIPYIL